MICICNGRYRVEVGGSEEKPSWWFSEKLMRFRSEVSLKMSPQRLLRDFFPPIPSRSDRLQLRLLLFSPPEKNKIIPSFSFEKTFWRPNKTRKQDHHYIIFIFPSLKRMKENNVNKQIFFSGPGSIFLSHTIFASCQCHKNERIGRIKREIEEGHTCASNRKMTVWPQWG